MKSLATSPLDLALFLYQALKFVQKYVVLRHSVMSNSATPWTVARQTPLSMEILQARILEWFAIPSPGDLANPGIKPRSPALLEDSLPAELSGKSKSIDASKQT